MLNLKPIKQERAMNKEAYYFSHDANARHDDKILELRAEFGWEGYGLFWAIVETLRDCSDYAYPSNAKAGLALSLNIDKTKLEQFLKVAIKLRLFIEKDGVIYSESLMRRMGDIDEKRRKRAEAGRLGGTAKAKAKQSSSNAKAKASKESKVKESKVKDIIEMPFDSEQFKTKWSEWKTYKSKHHKFEYKSDMSERSALTLLAKYASNLEHRALQILDVAMAQGWSGFHDLKSYDEPNGQGKLFAGQQPTPTKGHFNQAQMIADQANKQYK
jgi:hypothetical protein